MSPTANSVAEKYKQELRDKLSNRPKAIIQSIDHRYKCDPACEHCLGSGFVEHTNEETDFLGNVVEVPRTGICPALESQAKANLSGLTLAERENTWAHVMDDGDAKKAEALIKRVIDQGCGWVYLWGGPGIAKTILLKVAVADCLRNNIQATYTNMSAVLDHLREAYDTDYPNTESVLRLEKWASVKVLAIDEFDRLNQTPYAKEKQFRLMDERYQSAIRKKAVTLMASNANPATYADYLADRIEDGRFHVLEMKGDSLRPALDWTQDI